MDHQGGGIQDNGRYTTPSRRVRAAAALGTVLLLATACSFGPPPRDQAGEPPRFPTPSTAAPADPGSQELVASVLVKGLRAPWGLAFLPDGSALVTERQSARILQVGPQSDGGGLRVTEIQRLAGVRTGDEGGLLGIAVSPSYKKDRTVYVYYSTAHDNRVAKLTLRGEPQPILTGIPRSAAYDGGHLAFGPDGYLYIGTGDATDSGRAVNATGLGGKILRVTGAGKPASGNPKKNSPIWSIGHRNVQGFAWDEAKRMYAMDSGQPTVDEVNLIRKGGNYGWPAAQGQSTDRKLVNPLVTFPAPEGGCAGLAVQQRLIAAACLAGERLWLVETTGRGTVLGKPQALVVGQYGRLRTVVAAPDGSLWVMTSNTDGDGTPRPDDDRIIRLVLGDGGAGRT